MSGPWYECNGPSAKEVRKDVLATLLLLMLDE